MSTPFPTFQVDWSIASFFPYKSLSATYGQRRVVVFSFFPLHGGFSCPQSLSLSALSDAVASLPDPRSKQGVSHQANILDAAKVCFAEVDPEKPDHKTVEKKMTVSMCAKYGATEPMPSWVRCRQRR